MATQSSSNSTLSSRLLFLVGGVATGLVISVTDIGGIWAIPATIVGLVIFGELYLLFTNSGSDG
jgi:hypothetical protein